MINVIVKPTLTYQTKNQKHYGHSTTEIQLLVKPKHVQLSVYNDKMVVAIRFFESMPSAKDYVRAILNNET
jgi:hypothetical protein